MQSIHFIISKWDLIEDEYTLEEVKNHLLEIEQFRNIIMNRSNNNGNDKGVIRLIPVSSVGKGFAEQQTDGSMKKTGKLPKPYNIELPIACILPDKLQEELRKMINENEAIEKFSIVPQCGVIAIPECRHLWVGEKFVRIAWNQALQRIRPDMPELTWTWDGEISRWNDLLNKSE
jgi:hypothetical protein